MPEPQPFIVGRQSEVDRFAALIGNRTDHWLLNVYGPGGIGKTIVCQKLAAYARQSQLLYATVDGFRPDLTPDRILYTVKEGLAAHADLADAFSAFEHQFQEYLIIQEILQRGGGVPALFDVVGNIKDPSGFAQILGNLGKTMTEGVQRTVSNRFALERYLRGVEKTLTASLCDGVSSALAQTGKPAALLLDTYEEMEGLDDWVCRTFVPRLPEGVKIVVFGRNALPKVNFDWSEFSEALYTMELPELAEADARRYLEHHGLRDPAVLDQVYRFTGGYPLLLVLVVHLAREASGWDQIGALESEADRDRVASKLLDRILREERAREVRAFLEQGVIARWFNAEVIRVILEISLDEARSIYDKLQCHSFVERHPYGLKFHDKIRELLVDRLKFTSNAEYQRLTKRLMAYYAEKAGIEPADAAAATPPAQPTGTPEAPAGKYTITIQSGQGIVIGDHAQVVQTFPAASSPASSSGEAAEPEVRERQHTRRLCQIIIERLNLEDLRTLCFDLGVDFDSLRGEGKAAKVRELMLYLERRNDIQRLETWLRQTRPDITLPEHGA
jgi:hypothetical protein